MKLGSSKRGKGTTPGNSRDPKKEKVFAQLSKILGLSRVIVRREKLKQGTGWRVVSGSCLRNGDENLIFVDSRLAQDEQISFLATQISELGIQVPAEHLEALPKSLQERFAPAAP